MLDDLTTLRIERLRLAAALAHAIPQVALELHLEHGTSLVVSHDRSLSPDLSPCEFRTLVSRVSEHRDSILESGWVSEVDTITVGGHNVTVDGGSVAVVHPEHGRRITVFTTALASDGVMESARAVAKEFVETDPTAIVALRDVQLRVEHDPLLHTSVVILPWSVEEEVDDALYLTNAIAQRCWVDEFLAATPIR